MGRRSIIPVSQVRKLISSFNAIKKIKQQNEVINSSRNSEKEMPPKYNLVSVDFNEISRVARLEFIEYTKYRKIERYITRNYVRYPIYGDWNEKSKTIKKTIKLTNEILENLDHNSDFLIDKFACEIIERLNNPDLVPSWLIKLLLNEQLNDEVNLNHKNLDEYLKNNDSKISAIDMEMKRYIGSKQYYSKVKEKFVRKSQRIQKRISFLEKRSLYIIVSIFTLGIFAIFNRKNNLLAKSGSYENKILDLIINLKAYELTISKLDKEIIEIKNDSEREKEKVSKENWQITNKTNIDIDSIKPLSTSINSGVEDFIPLKELTGMEYEKIVGCYVIRNVELNKCYVGQSKDVLKRILKEHFSGIKVHNIVFAKDYYSSSIENKSDLFEVKIIRLNTKDELDAMEKTLIEKYDSFNSGYNGTNGNS